MKRGCVGGHTRLPGGARLEDEALVVASVLRGKGRVVGNRPVDLGGKRLPEAVWCVCWGGHMRECVLYIKMTGANGVVCEYQVG